MRLLLLFLFILLVVRNGYSQGGTSSIDCSYAVSLCNSDQIPLSTGAPTVPTIPSFGGISNPSTNPNPGNAGCLGSGELNPQWFVITIESSGFLEFQFSVAGNSGFFDWILWPYDSTACQNISLDSLAPLACNMNYASSGLTGMASPGNLPLGADQGNFESPISVSAGDRFIICVSNFSSVVGNLNFNSFGSAGICQSTASLSDDLDLPKKKLLQIFDTFGRASKDKPNTFLIYVYSDGTTEKVFRAE
jgi:hypothetical protein